MSSPWILIVLVAIAASAEPGKKHTVDPEPAFQYLTSDSVLLDVFEYYDEAGLLEGFRAHIISPVCEEGLCYEAELEFEWDLIGNFTRFRVDPDQPLTKLDHVPFSPADYEKLNKILHTESPSFIHLRRSELVAYPAGNQNGEVDAMTGATVKAVKKDMVEGAIYTCYTLWHIANGGIRFNIQQHSRRQLDEPLIKKLLARKEATTSYFLVEHMEPAYFAVFLKELLALAETYDAFFIGRMIQRMPDELYEAPAVQDFFRQHFQRLQPASRKAVIAKWEATDHLEPSTLLFLAEQFEIQDPEFNHRIINLIVKDQQADQPEILQNMVTVLCEREIAVPPESMALLNQLAEQDRRLKKILKPLTKK